MSKEKWVWLSYSVTILLGAFLMFLVQPLVGKIVTPQYGGVAQVWCLCLLFFQLALLGGYALTYVLSKFSLRVQGFIYLILMGASIFLIDIPLGDGWVPNPQEPVTSLLGHLTLYLALPCILLSTVSTMMQNWFHLSRQGDPYHLYSISNIGSMGALVVYPMLVEPNMSVGDTLQYWTWGYWLLVFFAIIAAIFMFKKGAVKETAKDEANNAEIKTKDKNIEKPVSSITDYFWWIGLSATGAVLLVSYSSHLTHDVAPIPLLWVIPLFIYLLTFVLCFGQKQIYNRSYFVLAAQALFFITVITYLGSIALFSNSFYTVHVLTVVNLLVVLVTLFLYGMICHGELYARRPEPKRLPIFYLSLALGGALGGVLVNFLAPFIFNEFYEFHLVNFAMLAFSLFLMLKFKISFFPKAKSVKWHKLYIVVFSYSVLFTTVFLCDVFSDLNVVYEGRNFYGVSTVILNEKKDLISFVNGTTIHGKQRINPESNEYLPEPTAYFSKDSAIAVVNRYVRERMEGKPLKIGVIGLGVGTIASYGEAGDEMTFYEIDPKVQMVAEDYFRFLKDSKAKVDVILGDGRLSLNHHDESKKYDILVIDAFNGDAVPVHLLTREAFQLYSKHVTEDGVILVQMSNRFLTLYPVVTNTGIDLDLYPLTLEGSPQSEFASLSIYGVLSKDPWLLDKISSAEFKTDFPNVEFRPNLPYPGVKVWTDDFSNVFSSLWFMQSKEDTLFKDFKEKQKTEEQKEQKIEK